MITERDGPTRISMEQAACYLVAILESRGGRFMLSPDGQYFVVDLADVDFSRWPGIDAECIEHIVRDLHEEIGASLRLCRVEH